MARKFGKKNEVKIDPLKYNICLLGESKIGKTTLIKEVCEKLVGEDGYMFIEMNGEAGADAIQGIVYEDVEEWADIEEIVEDIINNKTTDYADLKTVVMDTYDGWIKLAENEAVRLWNDKHRDKRTDTIDGSWNGFQKGQDKTFELMFDMIKELRKVGVATIVLGHVKNKEMTDIATGTTYQILTSDVEKKYFTLLKKKMHFLGLAYYDRTIVTEKTGKKNVVTKKDITVNKIVDQHRKIKFRDDNMALDSGSRFASIVDEIAFDPDEFIQAVTDAIKAEQAKSGKTFEQSEKEQAEKEAEEMKEIAKREAEKKEEKRIESVIDQIKDFIKDNKGNMEAIKPLLEFSKENGYANPTIIDDLSIAEQALKIITK